MSHWFLHVLIPRAESAAIYTISSGLVATFVLAPFRNALKRLRKRLSATLDSLDPDVPVGLTKQLDDVLSRLDEVHQHLSQPLPVKQTEPVEIKK